MATSKESKRLALEISAICNVLCEEANKKILRYVDKIAILGAHADDPGFSWPGASSNEPKLCLVKK